MLVDGSSASASEIVSGGLQDLDRAVIMGARSFGKGLVQRPLKLTYGTQLKVTISRYFTPSGRCIQALDYWNRDEDGNAVRNTQFNSFKTRNGRMVEDGGGVMPDIEITLLKTNDLIDALEENHIIFDFATEYFHSNRFEQLTDFRFSDADYTTFKNFVQKKGLAFKTGVEKMLEKQINDDKTLLGAEVKNNYKTTLLAINKGKVAALDTYKGEISKKITDELVKRYFYRRGLYDYNLTHDEAILTATSLLADDKAYIGVLE